MRYRAASRRLLIDPLFNSRRIPEITCPHFSIVPKRWHLGHSHHPGGGHNGQLPGKSGEYIFRLGLAADVFLSIGKAVTGYLSGSTAIIADAAHSVSDVVLSGVSLWSYKAAQVPKDSDHPYGHGKFETLGALGISCMLLATSGGIAWHALDVLQGLLALVPDNSIHIIGHEHVHSHHNHGIDMEHPTLALSMTVISISTKEGLYWITKRAGEKQGSGLMKANAWHHRADAVSSLVALIGVGGSILGIQYFDPLAGLIVSGMIFKAGLETGYQSILELVDAAVPADQLNPMKETIVLVEGVKGCHRLRGRRAGSNLYLDVHIEVDPFLSVSAAHWVGEAVRHQIHCSHPEVAEVFIHIDPSTMGLFKEKMDKQEIMNLISQNKMSSAKEKEIEAIILNVVSSKFSVELVVERITQHLLQGKLLVEVEISMPPEILIGDAMKVAKEAEKEILRSVDNIIYARFQLRLEDWISPSCRRNCK
ncbi:hypothetical protein MLD38_026392 [Melastoma candidum]|uniref:Uncharacterized protein n=1 Tax=Melastoma candidum TaxID=119954 RepID=A0ACB9NYB5_9MYRT|nr:hypothetical protein MLD38_026392 [Melastoma candidum]